MDALDKALKIMPGDIVSVARGRGWKRARVLKSLANGVLLIRFKDGMRTKVSADHVLTESEKKNFKKANGQTKIVRGENDRGGEDETDSDEIEGTLDEVSEEEPRRKRFGKLF